MVNPPTCRALAVVIALAVPPLLTAPASASPRSSSTRSAAESVAASSAAASAAPTTKTRKGACSSGPARWKLQATKSDGRIQVVLVVTSRWNGQTWDWALHHNGSMSDEGTATAGNRSKQVRVARSYVDLSGADDVSFRAHNPSSDELCNGSLSI